MPSSTSLYATPWDLPLSENAMRLPCNEEEKSRAVLTSAAFETALYRTAFNTPADTDMAYQTHSEQSCPESRKHWLCSA